jgi:nitroimidazol reductase NimA-like FMN-containing flavoprotein (pyridoxamine 5'-phosphate oxidase superfamily)
MGTALSRGAPGAASDRTAVRRLPDKQVLDVAARDAVLAAALTGTVAVVDGEQPYGVPVAVAPDRDPVTGEARVLVHGSTGSRLFRLLAGGAPACLTVTLVDGLVLARSQFESSMHYRCVMVLGCMTAVDDEDKARALRVLTEHLMPGRSEDARAASRKESAATRLLAMPLTEWSLKVSCGEPEDAAEDLDRPVWAGVVPLERRWGTPRPAADLRLPVPVPDYVGTWSADRA